jgi:xanthine/uracil/vitamin C permease (AzgA family)
VTTLKNWQLGLCIKAFSGRGREISWLTYVLAIALVLYFVFVRSRMS